ncbi:MAG: hypothetical protein GY834_02785 [Bacteroidetes bacterium]|nr:hypothetical protein [Bacteroidota bacterium]
MKSISRFLTLIMLVLLIDANAQFANTKELKLLEYRNLGPHRTGAWISSIAIPQTDNLDFKYSYYVAGRYGGVWKTINNGTTFFPIFDDVGVSSIGAVAVSSTNPDQIWVGTGEAYGARSTHKGEGVFKSVDGGKNWDFMGLEDSHHISTLIIHPGNPDIVWVAAMGHLFTPNDERGVFKTTNGGKTWDKTLFIDENTGIIDLIINPEDPNIMFAASYEKYRYPWHYEAGGENSAIYKSTDGGENWNKITNDLPTGNIGRIGLALCYNQPEIIYAVVENLNPKPGVTIDEDIEINAMRDPYFDQMIGGEVYRSNDDGLNWKKMNSDSCNVSAKAAYSFNKILVNPDNPDQIFISSDGLLYSRDGGKTWPNCIWGSGELFKNMFGDYRTFWVDPADGRHMMFGSDGGLYETFDGGLTVNHKYHIPLGEIYMVETDDAEPYNIYVGLQDHEAWKGPSNGWSGRIGVEDWNIVGMWDGMYTKVDPTDNRWAYSTTQFGGHLRIDQVKGERVNIQPKTDEGKPLYRFPWTPPLEISPHLSTTIYTGGQMLLRSKDQGDTWEEISSDLTTNDAKKIAGKGHMQYCTITSISESPKKAGIIWVGTDDGKIHLTKDDGRSWSEMTEKIHKLGGKSHYWVTRVVSSPKDAATAYVCKSGFRHDDFTPLIFKTTDFGKSWTKIVEGISFAPVNVIAEDPNRPNLLYAGNDEGVFISFDGGKQWQSFRNNMPVVAVKDLKIHPRENDLIVGTYGRGAFITDVSLLQQLNNETLNEDAILFNIEPKPLSNSSPRARWGNYELSGDSHAYTYNEENGLLIYYYFKTEVAEETKLSVFDTDGKLIRDLPIDKSSGLHKINWYGRNTKVGEYLIKLEVDGKIIEQRGIINPSPIWPIGNTTYY